MTSKDHWKHVYGNKASAAVSWFAPFLVESLGYIQRTEMSKSAASIDVGGGEATLVDDLLDADYRDAFESAVHVLRNTPGAGKTPLLRRVHAAGAARLLAFPQPP